MAKLNHMIRWCATQCWEAFLLPTTYVVRREGYVLTRVCPSVCPHPGGGGTLARSSEGYPTSGTPSQTLLGVPQPGGYPTSGTPIRPGQGYPTLGTTPPSDLAGGIPHLWYHPPSDLAGGNPNGGYPTLGTPQLDLAGGYPDRGYPTSGTPIRPGRGVPRPGGYPTSVVFDTPR